MTSRVTKPPKCKIWWLRANPFGDPRRKGRPGPGALRACMGSMSSVYWYRGRLNDTLQTAPASTFTHPVRVIVFDVVLGLE